MTIKKRHRTRSKQQNIELCKVEDIPIKDKLNFDLKELVLCFHGPQLYEAKVENIDWYTSSDEEDANVKYENKDPSGKSIKPLYLIHYKGWNQSWDEWVTETRMLKLNEEGLQKQRELREKLKPRKAVAKAKATQTNSTSTNGGSNNSNNKTKTEKQFTQGDSAKESTNGGSTKNKKLKLSSPDKRSKGDSGTGESTPKVVKDPINLRINIQLKLEIVKQWDLITSKKMLIPLNRSHSVKSCLEDFLKYKTSDSKLSKEELEQIEQMTVDFTNLFDNTLGSFLLFSLERPQFIQKLNNIDLTLSDYYPPEYLLRLLVKLPEFIQEGDFTKTEEQFYELQTNELLNFLGENSGNYFSNSYECASREILLNSNIDHLSLSDLKVNSHH
ncbi:hypothetical protein CONCODRAFT_78721 [Conidiobolus coronatus NRRL 28638]|uniref:Chromatin modification-related protein EAF3 n=1 Tax=Conidiobolus coronatus (strain ATCC 28846 / CBS 209.66 / NRRL 28638) TaxID=796925 RepID=A0A137P6R3_CONC2|nr:hypothetical protein CONCODRAFT_78721 [Conidiobolus coronatus NRRL 28638]|eukprot:KXN70703.1 hypothetical protein CONCODRAFT_78721 [Conidiobolus coronatus NRRL 28638]